MTWTRREAFGLFGAAAAGPFLWSCGGDERTAGGSIRFPSAQCGIVGLKPTWS